MLFMVVHINLFCTNDSHQRGEVWEGSGFKQQRESGLHALSVVGRQSQREGSNYPLVLTKSEREVGHRENHRKLKMRHSE